MNFVIITLSQLQSKEVENGMLQKQLNELVINALPDDFSLFLCVGIMSVVHFQYYNF